MQELRHPLTEGVYGLDPETGLVRVEEHGRVGLFDFTASGGRETSSIPIRRCVTGSADQVLTAPMTGPSSPSKTTPRIGDQRR